MKAYRRLLSDVDAWYRGVKERHPAEVPCEKGCRDCCLGLFDISIADRDLLREGLARAGESVRRDIQARAADVLRRLRDRFPQLGDTLEGLDDAAVDALCDALGPVECPVLGPDGACRLYEHRPLTCRLAGVPVVDVSGEVIAPDGCSKCTLKAGDAPRLDCRGVQHREQRVLEAADPKAPDARLLIAQAVAP